MIYCHRSGVTPGLVTSPSKSSLQKFPVKKKFRILCDFSGGPKFIPERFEFYFCIFQNSIADTGAESITNRPSLVMERTISSTSVTLSGGIPAFSASPV